VNLLHRELSSTCWVALRPTAADTPRVREQQVRRNSCPPKNQTHEFGKTLRAIADLKGRAGVFCRRRSRRLVASSCHCQRIQSEGSHRRGRRRSKRPRGMREVFSCSGVTGSIGPPTLPGTPLGGSMKSSAAPGPSTTESGTRPAVWRMPASIAHVSGR
jgi:hypothetical protein